MNLILVPLNFSKIKNVKCVYNDTDLLVGWYPEHDTDVAYSIVMPCIGTKHYELAYLIKKLVSKWEEIK